MSWDPERFLAACNFASHAHRHQKVPGADEPYLRHVVCVAGEVMAALAQRTDVLEPDLAVVCALLHDVAEDTEASVADIRAAFGEQVAQGVSALTKDPSLPTKDAQMADCLARILQQPGEIWMVKLADRITNLQTPPPHWPPEKVSRYRGEAQLIHDTLAPACPILASRLAAKIAVYPPTA